MTRAKTASFVCELPLRVTPRHERQLLVRLDCARMVYNACLGEALKRLGRVRASAEYQSARLLPRQSKARTEAFRAANKQYGFREYDLHAYAVQFGHSWLGEHLDSNVVQNLATRAFVAVQRYVSRKGGRPRFKGKGGIDSVEGKTNTSGIRWRENTVQWLGLELPALINLKDDVVAYGLTRLVKFVRLVRRKLNGRNRFYAQLVCEGLPYRKPKNVMGQGVIGLDIGPSSVATVSADGKIAQLEHFCDELKSKQTTNRKLQRKLDRQRRANNPQNYNPIGTVKKGAREWHCSNRHLYSRGQLADVHRRQAAHRKSLHGRMVNRTLAQGDVIKLEKLSYRAFQTRFGKSVGFRGPGSFVSHLRRKAANAGAQVDEFPTRTTRLSQTCLCGAIVGKPLSLRWHVCPCGVGPVQRDLFSAWLACFVDGERLDAGQAQAAWPSVDARLRTASSEIQPAMGQGNPPNPVRGQSRSSVQSSGPTDKAGVDGHVISARESVAQPEPPGFSRREQSAAT